MSDFLKVSQLGKVYQKGPTRIEVLQDLDFSLAEGESVSIVGESGTGKSTFLQIIGALLEPSHGEVFFRKISFQSMGEKKLAEFRNRSVGFVFQFHYLLPEFTALENVTLPLRMRGEPLKSSAEEARKVLIQLGLEKRFAHRPAELSGGEQQRVAIARALVGKPDLLLADEPTGNLDIETAREVASVLFGVVEKMGKSLVVATHNIELAQLAHRTLRLHEGKLIPEPRI